SLLTSERELEDDDNNNLDEDVIEPIGKPLVAITGSDNDADYFDPLMDDTSEKEIVVNNVIEDDVKPKEIEQTTNDEEDNTYKVSSYESEKVTVETPEEVIGEEDEGFDEQDNAHVLEEDKEDKTDDEPVEQEVGIVPLEQGTPLINNLNLRDHLFGDLNKPKEVFELNKPKDQNENNEKSIDEQTVNENTEQSVVEFEGLFNKEQKQKEGTQSDVRQEAQENVPVVKKDDIDIVPKEDKEVDVDL